MQKTLKRKSARSASRTKARPHRVADDITRGFQEIEAMMAAGKKPEDCFMVRKISFPDPGHYTAGAVKELRGKLGVSQAKFASAVGVSTVLMQSWEQGKREPSPLARRMLDQIAKHLDEWRAMVGTA